MSFHSLSSHICKFYRSLRIVGDPAGSLVLRIVVNKAGKWAMLQTSAVILEHLGLRANRIQAYQVAVGKFSFALQAIAVAHMEDAEADRRAAYSTL